MKHLMIGVAALAAFSLTVALAASADDIEATADIVVEESAPQEETPPVSAKPPSRVPSGMDGLRKVVAVARFENRTNLEGQVSINDALADQLTHALSESGQFTVLERQTVQDVMREQDFANSGRVMKRKSARTGRIVAAQILIKGTITEFEGQAATSMRGVDLGLVKFGRSGTDAHVGLMIRMIDATTGEVLGSELVEGTSKERGFGFQVGIFGQKTSKKAPMAKATQEAINKAVGIIAERLAKVPFQARVIKNLGPELIIGAGERVGAQEGDEFAVYALGEELIDPYTGEDLGSEEEYVGVVRITQVKEKYSKASPAGPLGAVKAGDIIRALGR